MSDSDKDKVSRRLRLEQFSIHQDVSSLARATEKSGGLEDNEIRKLAWPVMLARTKTPLREAKEQSGLRQRGNKRQKMEHEASGSLLQKARSLPAHPDENQVKLDVERSFVSLLEGADKTVKAQRREQLQEIIVSVLRLHPQLHYFQGFHDIVGVCLLVLDDPERTLVCVEHLSLFQIRDSMGATIEPVMGYLRLLRRILRAKDPTFAAVVERAANLPYFSLSWVLTLLSHDIPDLASSARLFDFLLSHNPALMSYLAAALVLEKRSAVDDLQQDPEFADDPAMLHTTLSKLPSLSPTGSKRSPSQTSLKELEHEKEDIAYWADPDVSTPAFQEIKPVVFEQPTLSVDDLITRTLDLWTAFPLQSSKIRVKELFGDNGCIFTYDRDLSVEEAESIVASGKDVVKLKPAKVAKLPFKRPLQVLLQRRMLVTAVGTVGLGIVLVTLFGSERKGVGLAELVWAGVNRLADSQPLFYFLNFPCRRAEVVGLVIGTTCTSSSITYMVDDGTAIIDCTLTAQQSDVAASPIIKGKRKAEPGDLSKPGHSFENVFQVGSVVRVLGFIQEHFGGNERYLRVDEIKRVHRLSEEAEHARKTRELRLTTYTERLDLTLAFHRMQMEQAEAPSGRLQGSEAMQVGPSRLPPSPVSRSSQNFDAPSLDISFFLEDETKATPRPSKRSFSMSQSQSAIDLDADEPSYTNTNTLITSQILMPRPQPRLHAPHRLKDEQLHVDTFNSYLYDYFCRHSSEVVTYRQLYTSKNFAPLARRLVRKLVADGLSRLESDAARQLVSELTRISQRSENKAVDCLYLRTLTQLCSSMYIAPSPTDNDAYQFVTLDTLGPTLFLLLRNRPRTPHELVAVLRRGEERWRWARTERVHVVLRDMVDQRMAKAVRDGRFAAV